MVDFSQSSVAFKNSYNPVFLADLESVPYKEKNEDASPYNLYEVFKEEGPVPDGGTWLEAFLFLGIFALLESVFILIVWALNSQEVPWLVFLLLGGLFVYHVYRIVSWRLFMRKLATAWKNGWIDCYPAWLGSLYFDENNVKSGKSKYFYRTKLMIMAPSGETHTFEDFEAQAESPRELESNRVALASDLRRVRLDPQRNNGWSFFAAVRGKPLGHGSLETGLNEAQIAAGLERVHYGWPLDKSPFEG